MKQGDLIAVNNNLYEYGGIQEGLHKVYVIDIDEEGILTHTCIPWYVTDEEISNRGIELTQRQWLGLTEHFIRQEYDLADEEIQEIAEDIVYRCFAVTRKPLVEELPMYITLYMNR